MRSKRSVAQARPGGVGTRRLLISGLAPEVIMVIGEVTAAWDRLVAFFQDVVKRSGRCPHAATRIVPTVPATQPRLRGAVTLVVQQHFGAPLVA